MVPLNELTAETILSDEIFAEVFDQEDEIYKARLLLSLQDRAAALGVKTKFDTMVKAYKKVEREMRKREQTNPISSLDNWTNFTGPYDNMQCKEWIATENGICLRNNTTGYTDVLACYHPILPVERMKNLQTGEEQIRLAYKRNGRWEEIIVPKMMIASASKIVTLSSRGVAVTSETAKYLVRYLADVENANDNYIKVQYSTSKLGWLKGGFLPYDKEIIFDGDMKFREIYESISEFGNRNVWFDHVKKLRKTGRIEIKFMLAASFSSVLVSLLGGLPFFVDLWGGTEAGKSVTLMLAASVWANPNDNTYIKDYANTDVGLEVTCDVLNSLPLMLDDTSKKDKKIEERFESIIYNLCSGKGKTRSNKEIGLNKESNWKNCMLTNGEYPLTSYVSQGGAINRVLELESGSRIYPDVHETLGMMKKNYGFAGKEFIQTIKDIGTDRIVEIQREFLRKLANDEKMQKQSMSLSIILTADKIATDYLFEDSQYIDFEKAKSVLVDRNELSENERCYQYILGEVAINSVKFDPTLTTNENWGVLENGYAVIHNNIMDVICKKGNFSKKAFLAWASKKGLIQMQNGNPTKVKKINGNSSRCVFLKLDDGVETDKDGFQKLDEDSQMELPFK